MNHDATARPARPGTFWLIMLAICLIGAGVLVLRLNGGMRRWTPPPVPPAAAARAVQAPTARAGVIPGHARPAAFPLFSPSAAPLPRSAPVSLRIPAIGVNARVISLGLDSSGGQAAPPLDTPFLTSWFDKGPTPGQDGPAVLAGHVDSAKVGPAVFYKLGDLKPGNLVYVAREDHRTAVFRITSVALYPQQHFPGQQVYGPTPGPALRLVTCGGDFDTHTHVYLDRTIAFADYVRGTAAGRQRPARGVAEQASGTGDATGVALNTPAQAPRLRTGQEVLHRLPTGRRHAVGACRPPGCLALEAVGEGDDVVSGLADDIARFVGVLEQPDKTDDDNDPEQELLHGFLLWCCGLAVPSGSARWGVGANLPAGANLPVGARPRAGPVAAEAGAVGVAVATADAPGERAHSDITDCDDYYAERKRWQGGGIVAGFDT